MKKPLLSLVFIAIVGSSLGQTKAEYLKLRSKFKVTEAASPAALEVLVGERTLEIRGRVKGSIVSSDGSGILYIASDSGDLSVSAKSIPEWLKGTDTTARLIVHAKRQDVQFALECELIGAARDEDVRPYDSTSRKKSSSSSSKSPKGAIGKQPAREVKSSPSRGGFERSNPRIDPNEVWTVSADEALPHYKAYVKKINKRLSDAQTEEIARAVIGFSMKYGVDARLIMAIVLCESDFNPKDVSHAGAMGLGQLMPDEVKRFGISNVFDETENLYGTVRLIKEHLDRYGPKYSDTMEVLRRSLAAYNAGVGAVKKYDGVPPYKETQNYVRKVIKAYRDMCGIKD
jgi:soluble lytic murein transglycosylase-like protein